MGQIFLTIPIDQIDVPHDWNARIDGRAPLERPDEGDAFLDSAVAAQGIQIPLLVRAVDTVPPRYQLVAGFRRLAAAQRAGIGEAPCVVRSMSPAQARELNIAENLCRQPLSACELSRGICDWVALAKPPKPARDAAEQFGLRERWTAQLLRVRRKASPEVLAHWERHPQIGIDRIADVCTLARHMQLAALMESLSPKPKQNASSRRPADQHEPDPATAERLAALAKQPLAYSRTAAGVHWRRGVEEAVAAMGLDPPTWPGGPG